MNYNCTGITGIEILSEVMPKLKYKKDIGELDLSVGGVEVTNTAGTTAQVALSQLTVTGFNNTSTGFCKLTLIYNSFSIKLTVEIVSSSIKSISVSTNPNKRFYKINEALDVSGGELKISFYDDTSEYKDLSLDMLTGYDSGKYGEQIITVTHDGYKASFTVEVYKTGDINGDLNINSVDIAMLRECLLSIITGNVKFDMNGDGETDILDLVRIKKLATK